MKFVELSPVSDRARRKLNSLTKKWVVLGRHENLDPYYFENSSVPHLYLAPACSVRPNPKGSFSMWVQETGDPDYAVKPL